ncbi:alkaline phosphatase D family protein [Pseudofulvibacter geojedonensis]|uniref:Alkaline phosphatase D family protein n=1 Tax=Pseudofulvibacter geojedonensis TaxID=1123758 RepID=A0ABW3HYK8_9FLAO
MRKLLFIILMGSFYLSWSQSKNATITQINRNISSGNIEDYFDSSLAPFYHGVASGDPTDNAVVIWTRITTNAAGALVKWSVATDPSMNTVVQSGIVITNDTKDYTAKVDVTGLNAGATYYYQFESSGQKSIIGKTRTAPTGTVNNVRFGVVSCSNYQNGYFTGYQELANRTDIDVILHLGDYIYEYESGGYGYSSSIGRGHLPANETVTLNDYRVRYSYYRLDPMLRNLHQQHPFILIWDDHEFSNDANKYSAENHDNATEGSWETRKNNAYKAYFEWLPIRANSIEEYRLYREFSFGNLVDLYMLDTRIVGRGEALSSKVSNQSLSKEEKKSFIKDLIQTKSINSLEDCKELLRQIAPLYLDISLLTNEEIDFLIHHFAHIAYEFKQNGVKVSPSKYESSKAREVINKAYVNSNHDIRNSYVSILGEEQYNWLTSLLQGSTATWRIIGNQVMLMPFNGVPTNDAWDGYSEERERLLKFLDDNTIRNNVILTGDIHSMFSGNVEYNNTCQAVEFIVPSITSENLDAYGGVASWLAETYALTANSHMKDVNLDGHGYYILDVSPNRVQADWYFINDITSANSGQYYYKSWFVDKDVCNVVETNAPTEAVLSYGEYPYPVEANSSSEDLIVIGVYPNPLESQGNIHFIVNNKTELNFALYDFTGKKVYEIIEPTNFNKGVYNLNFSINSSLSSGMYLLRIKYNDKIIMKKIQIK